MNILYIYAHPNANSFNAKIQRIAIAQLKNLGHQMQQSDLYMQQFNPLASWQDFNVPAETMAAQYFLAQQQALQQHCLADDIVAEIEKLKRAEHIIFQFPLWWFSVPAILKGWFDRVLVKGFAYDVEQTFANGLLAGKTASFIITTQSPEAAYQLDGIHATTIESFLLPVQHTLRFVGIKPGNAFVIYGAYDLSNERQNEVITSLQKFLELPKLYGPTCHSYVNYV